MKFKTNEQGEMVLTPDEFEAALSEQAKKVTDEVEERLKKTAPPPPMNQPEPTPVFTPAPDESIGQKHSRLYKAVAAVRGGKLRIEDAPKEIKTIAFFRAMQEKNDVVVRALSEGSANDGGNLVPIEFSTDLKVAIETYGSIQDCTRHTMNANELDLRSVTTKPLVYDVDEGAQITEAAPKFGKPQLIAHAFAGIQVMSKEVFSDNNVGLYQQLVTLFAEQFAKRQSTELFVGSTFTGIFGSVTPTTTTLDGTSLANVSFKKLVAMVNSLSPGQLGGGGKWYMHRNVFAYIQGLEDLNGRPVIQNPWDARMRTLLGYPVVLDEAMPYTDAADTAFVVFGNLMWVDFGMRQEVTSSMLTEGTVATINLAEKRSLGLVIDTRWGLVVSIPGNLAILKTKA